MQILANPVLPFRLTCWSRTSYRCSQSELSRDPLVACTWSVASLWDSEAGAGAVSQIRILCCLCWHVGAYISMALVFRNQMCMLCSAVSCRISWSSRSLSKIAVVHWKLSRLPVCSPVSCRFFSGWHVGARCCTSATALWHRQFIPRLDGRKRYTVIVDWVHWLAWFGSLTNVRFFDVSRWCMFRFNRRLWVTCWIRGLCTFLISHRTSRFFDQRSYLQ